MRSIVCALVGSAVTVSAQAFAGTREWESESMVRYTNGEIAKHDFSKTLQTLLLALNPAAATRRNFAQTSPQRLMADRASMPTMGNIADTLATIEGPDLYWEELGPLQNPMKEESDFKEYDTFSSFLAACASNGVDLKANGITVLAPGNKAVHEYTAVNGPLTKAICEHHIIKGVVPVSSLSSADLTTVQGGKITYRRMFRKDFVDNAFCAAMASPPRTSYKGDIQADNGIIHFINEVIYPGWTESGEAPASQAAPAAASAPATSAPAAVPAAASAPGGALPKTGVWDFATKKLYYDAWDPEKPRDYNNFNPFERNDESAMADMSGCFPGQSRGYKSPIRPDMDWAKMQEDAKLMDALKQEAKFNIKGRPGNFHLKWQENLGAPP
jgi:uncharacterized surface protein with fasciclin (FAS1) repeats